jgi:nitroimidazol reductase NimA-like FMN-containing flavoprotein (pyridoxamine 5'-phosphate oxidase superfamily)
VTGERTARPYSEVRRADRAVQDDAWIIAILQSVPFGGLATVCDGQPFINNNLFAFDEAAHAMYTHTAALGRTRSNVEEDNRCCFSVSQMGRLLPHETALGMSVEYASVVVFGRASVVKDVDERERALQLLLAKYFPHLHPGIDYRAITPQELAITTVYRIEIDEWSGKRKQVESDFPGAFVFGEMPGTNVDRQ